MSITTKTKRKPTYTVILQVEASRLPTVQAEAEKAFGKESVRSMRKNDPASSRSDRLDAIANDVQNAVTDVEELKDELQEWYDNLPENFQQGDKGSGLEEAISQLEEIKGSLEGVDFSSVSFPTMF